MQPPGADKPLPVVHVYSALVEHDPAAPLPLAVLLAREMEANPAPPRIKVVPCVRDHAMPVRKPRSSNFLETYTPSTILKRGWTAKHQDAIPACIIVTVEVSSLSPQAEKDAGDRYERVRANLAASGRATTPAALVVTCEQDTDPLTWPDRARAFLANIRRYLQRPVSITPPAQSSGSGAPGAAGSVLLQHRGEETKRVPPCALQVFARTSMDKDTVGRLRQSVIDAAMEFYKGEVARIKALKRGDPKRPGAMALGVRHEYKTAQYYEMRQASDKALVHYQESYQTLVSLARLLESGQQAYAPSEIRAAAEVVHHRICALRLESGDARAALGQLKTHTRAMAKVYVAPAPEPEYWDWMSRQRVVFAGLLSTTPLSAVVLGALDSVEREKCDPLYHVDVAAELAANGRCPGPRALDLLLRLVEAQRKRKGRDRKEAALLVRVADERVRMGDAQGAEADLVRALAVVRTDHWDVLIAAVLQRLQRLPDRAWTTIEAQLVVAFAKSLGAEEAASRLLSLAPVVGQVRLENDCQLVSFDVDKGHVVLFSKLPVATPVSRLLLCGRDVEVGQPFEHAVEASVVHPGISRMPLGVVATAFMASEVQLELSLGGRLCASRIAPVLVEADHRRGSVAGPLRRDLMDLPDELLVGEVLITSPDLVASLSSSDSSLVEVYRDEQARWSLRVVDATAEGSFVTLLASDADGKEQRWSRRCLQPLLVSSPTPGVVEVECCSKVPLYVVPPVPHALLRGVLRPGEVVAFEWNAAVLDVALRRGPDSPTWWSTQAVLSMSSATKTDLLGFTASATLFPAPWMQLGATNCQLSLNLCCLPNTSRRVMLQLTVDSSASGLALQGVEATSMDLMPGEERMLRWSVVPVRLGPCASPVIVVQDQGSGVRHKVLCNEHVCIV